MKTDQSMTSRQSLELIARMLKNTQERFERRAGRPFILFGYLTAAVSLAVWYALKTTGDWRWNWLWFAIPALGGLGLLLLRKQKVGTAITFIDRAVGQLWTVLGACAILLALYTLFFVHSFPILPVMALLMFAGEAITGAVIRLRYIQIMGWVGIVLSFGLTFLSGLDQVPGFGALFLLAMAVPGHMMSVQAAKWAENNRSDGHV